MTFLPSSHPIILPAIRTRQQLEAVMENIVQLRLERIELERSQECEIANVRQKFRAPLAEVERYLTLEMTWAENWARENPAALGAERSLTGPCGTIGFRRVEARVERASRRWTWSAIVQKLTEADWGHRYLRIPPPEVDKEAILSNRAQLPAEVLRQAGIKIVEGERFFLTPLKTTETAAAEPDSDWEEAA